MCLTAIAFKTVRVTVQQCCKTLYGLVFLWVVLAIACQRFQEFASLHWNPYPRFALNLSACLLTVFRLLRISSSTFSSLRGERHARSDRKLNVREGKEEEFEAVMLDLAANVNANEPGCHLYKLCKDSDGGYMVGKCTKTKMLWQRISPLSTSKPRRWLQRFDWVGLQKSSAWKLWANQWATSLGVHAGVF